MDAEKKLVLVTGSAGNVGRCVCAALRPHCTVRGFDLAPSPGVDESHTGTLTDRAAVDRAMAGVHTVIHLAAHPNHTADFMTELLRPNVEGLWHVYDSARAAGVRRMIFASSCHTIFGHPLDQPLTPADLPRVSNPYGATKVFGEVLGQHFHDAHGLEFLAVRIGFFTPRGRDETGFDYLRVFVEEMKSSGFVAERIAAHGVKGLTVAPPA